MAENNKINQYEIARGAMMKKGGAKPVPQTPKPPTPPPSQKKK